MRGTLVLRFSSLLRFALCSLLTVLLTGCNTFTSKPELLPDCNVTCYISETPTPGASVQLVVKVGSLQEQEHEQGFAHFIEHIAFNDTRDYPQEQLFARLRELGIEMGNHSNGMTHFDNTHYSLSLNNSHPDNLWQIHPEITPRLLDSQTVADKTRQWQFANGMTVFHRYNGNVPGRFSFSLTAENGLNLLATDQQPMARSVMGILSASGMRELGAVELDQWLKKRKISLQSKMNFFSRELWGHARTEDFAEVMQLLHVILTEAEASDDATVRYQSKKLREYQRQVATPRQVLQRYLDRAQFNNHPALKAMDSDDFSSLNQNGLNRIYQTFLRGAQNYQLAIVGDIAETAAYPKIFSYIASLPASERQHRIEQSYPFPQKSETIDLMGNNSKATLLVARLALKKEQLSDYNYDQVMFMAYWVRQHLMQQLREQHGMTYDIHVHLEGYEALRPDFTLDISLNCDPDQVSTVRDVLNAELDNMVSDPPSVSHIKQWQTARYRELTDSFRNPVIQAAGLTRAQLSEYTPAQLLDVKARTQPPSGAELARMLARFISPEAVKTYVIWRARK